MSYFTAEDYRDYIADEKHTIETLKAMIADAKSSGMSRDFIENLEDQIQEAEDNIRFYERQLANLS